MKLALAFIVALAASVAGAQTRPPSPSPAPAAPPGQTGAPAPAPRAPSPAATAARTTLLLTVTNTRGLLLPGVRVDLSGPLTREGVTDDKGTLRLTGLRAGAYRARFSGEQVTTFEKEISVRAGATSDVDIVLSPAEERPAPPPPPAPAPPPPPPPPPAPPVGPAGQPRTASLVDLAEKELIGRGQPRRESLVACSGNTRSTLVQLNQEQPQRLYEGAESLLYVVAGEGSVRLSGRETALGPGSFVSIPRNMPYALSKRGGRPLIFLSVLAGEPCEQAQ